MNKADVHKMWCTKNVDKYNEILADLEIKMSQNVNKIYLFNNLSKSSGIEMYMIY